MTTTMAEATSPALVKFTVLAPTRYFRRRPLMHPPIGYVPTSCVTTVSLAMFVPRHRAVQPARAAPWVAGSGPVLRPASARAGARRCRSALRLGPAPDSTAWAAARRATGTRKGEQLT